jgi:hypothetical protein
MVKCTGPQSNANQKLRHEFRALRCANGAAGHTSRYRRIPPGTSPAEPASECIPCRVQGRHTMRKRLRKAVQL